jgi:hypothetical protein
MPNLKSAEHYRREAERCRALAEASRVPGVRQTLLDIATMYDGLARQVVLMERAGRRLPRKRVVDG